MGGLAIAGVFLVITILCFVIIGLVCLYKRRDKLKTEWARIIPNSRTQSQEHLLPKIPDFNTITIELSPEGCTGRSQHFLTQDRKHPYTDKMFNGGSRGKYYNLAENDEYASPSEIYLHKLLQAGSKYPRQSTRDPYGVRNCYPSSVSRKLSYQYDDMHMALLDERRRAYRQSSSNELCRSDYEEVPLHNGYRAYRNTHRMWDTETGKSPSSDDIDPRQLADIKRYGEKHAARIRRVHFKHKLTRSCPEERELSKGNLRGILRSTSLIDQKGTYDGQCNTDIVRQSRSMTDHKHATDIVVDMNGTPINPITTGESLKEGKDEECGEDSWNTSVKEIIAGLNKSINGKTARSPSPKKSMRNVIAELKDTIKARHYSNVVVKHNKTDSACQTSFDEGINEFINDDKSAATDSNSSVKQTQMDHTVGETNARLRDTRKSTSSTSLKSVKDVVGGQNERQNKRTGTKVASIKKSGNTNDGNIRTHSMIPTLNRSPTAVPSMKEAAGEACYNPKEPNKCHPKPQHISVEDIIGKSTNKSTTLITPDSPFLKEKVESYDSETKDSPIETSECFSLPHIQAYRLEEEISKHTRKTPPPTFPRIKKNDLAKPETYGQITREPNSATRQMSVKEIVAELNCSLHDDSKNNSSPTKGIPMKNVSEKVSDTLQNNKDTNSLAEMSCSFTDEASNNLSPTKTSVEKRIGDDRVNTKEVEETNSTKPTKTVKEIVDEIKKECRNGKDSDLIIRQFTVDEVSDDSNDDTNETETYSSPFSQSPSKQHAVDINVNHNLLKATTHSTQARGQSVEDLVFNLDRHAHVASRDASPTNVQATSRVEVPGQNLLPDSEKHELWNSEDHVMSNVNASSGNINRNVRHFIKSDMTVDDSFAVVGEYRRKSKDYLPSSTYFGTKHVPSMPTLSDSCNLDFQNNEYQEVLHSPDKVKTKDEYKPQDTMHIQRSYKSADTIRQTERSQKDITVIERHSPTKGFCKVPVSTTVEGSNSESTKLHNEDLNGIHLSHASLSSVEKNPNERAFFSQASTTDSPSGNKTSLKTDPLVTAGTAMKRNPKPTPPKVAPRPINRRGSSCKANKLVSPSIKTELIQPISPTTTCTPPESGTAVSHLISRPSDVYSTRGPDETNIQGTIQDSNANPGQYCKSLVSALKFKNNDSPTSRNGDVSHEYQDIPIRKPCRRVSFSSPIAIIVNDDYVTSDPDTEDEESDDVGVSKTEPHTPTTSGNSCSGEFVLKCSLPDKVPMKTCSVMSQLCSPDTSTTPSVLQSDDHTLGGHKKPFTDVSTVSKVYTNTRWSMRMCNAMPSIANPCVDGKDTELNVPESPNKTLTDPPPSPSGQMAGSLSSDITSKDSQVQSDPLIESYTTCSDCQGQGNETDKDTLDYNDDCNVNDIGVVTGDSSDGRFEEMDLGTKRNYGRRISLDTVIADIVTRRRAERRQTKSHDTSNGDEN